VLHIGACIKQEEVLRLILMSLVLEQFELTRSPPCSEMVALIRSVATVNVAAVDAGSGLNFREWPCPQGSRGYWCTNALPAASATGFGWLYFCQFSHSMKLENVKIKTSIRRRVSMNSLQKNS
jgi:hypothetical protein